MKIKIELKTLGGSVLFTYESKDNTIKETLIRAVEEGAYLIGADLRGAYLRGADLRGAYLIGANLYGADLRGAYLRGADLRGAYLIGADLRGAYLIGANLYGADLRGAYLRGADLRGADEKIIIEKCAVFTGLYKYVVMAIIDKEGKKWIKMGCFTREVKDWKDDFWNNKNEFPNDNSESSNLREFAYKTALNWFKSIR